MPELILILSNHQYPWELALCEQQTDNKNDYGGIRYFADLGAAVGYPTLFNDNNRGKVEH
jgi:hypothetical protein